MSKLKDITENRMLMLAGGITLGIYLLFGLLARPDIKPLPRVHTPALKLTYVPPSDTALDKMEALWSPSLFSIPAAQGFSRDFLNSYNFETEASRREGDRFNRFLEAPLSEPEGAPLQLTISAEPSLQISVKKTASVFEGFQGPLPSPVQLTVANGLAARMISKPDLRNIAGLPTGNWQQTASITVNTFGQVTHAFMEPQGIPASPALINALYQLQFEPAEKEVQGRVTIYSINGKKAE